MRQHKRDGTDTGAHAAVRVSAGSDSADARHDHLLQVLLGGFDHSNRALVVLDGDQRIMRANRACQALFGREVAQVLNQPIGTLLHGGWATDRERRRLQTLPWGRGPVHVDLRAYTNTGGTLWLRLGSAPAADAGDSRLRGCSLNLFQDITNEHYLRRLERDVLRVLSGGMPFAQFGAMLCSRIRKIIPDILPALWMVDAKGRLRPWAVDALPVAYAHSLDGLRIGEGQAGCGTAAARDMPVVCKDIEHDPLWASFAAHALRHGLRASWSYPIHRHDGSVAGVLAFYAGNAGLPGALHQSIIEACTHQCMLAVDMEERRLRTEQLASYDGLTGLPNQYQVRRYIQHLVAKKKEPLAVVTLGLDGFRLINEGLGHDFGDEVLRVMANRFQALLTSDEIVGHYEGDMFVTVTPGCDAFRALHRAEQFQEAAANPVEIDGRRLQLTACAGIAVCPGSSNSANLRENSKKAMYEAKSAGRGVCRFFSPDMNHRAQERLLQGNALQRALADGCLRLHYQPQVKLDDGRLYGVEALARWTDPVYGVVSPEHFIGIAEEIGEIEALGRWALREACRQLAEWRASRLQVPVVSVNLSAHSFRDATLPDYIAGLLHEYALSGGHLTVEITETTAMALSAKMSQVIGGVRALGVGLSMDDFGTGFSSLSAIAGLPVTEVKIDRSFIDKLHADARILSVVRAVIGMGRSLSLSVVAEGVETQAQRALLRQQYPGIIVQGYLLAPPLEPRQLSAWLTHARTEAVAGANGVRHG
jgi:c-di-GMP-specific phosphodiesterase